MTPSIPVRLNALQRDTRAFQVRVDMAADALPGAPSRDRATLARVLPLYDAAELLHARAIDLAADMRLGGSKFFDGESQRQAEVGARAVLNSAWSAERTVAQRTHVGEHSHAEMTYSSVRAGSAPSAVLWQRAIGEHDLPNTRIVGKLAPPSVNLVADRLENAPAAVIEMTDRLGTRAALFSGKLTDVRGYMSHRGERPRGWPAGTSWDTLPGGGDAKGFAANPSRELTGRGHASTSLALHEYAHTVDAAFAAPRYREMSESSTWRRGPWREMRRREAPGVYLKSHAKEWFAESFARFSKSQQSSAALARWYPETYAYLRERLGVPQFRR